MCRKWNSSVLRLCWVNVMLRGWCLMGVVVLAGCATTAEQCDPGNHDAGILDKAGCVYGGHYQERIDSRQTVLLDEQKTNRLFRETFEALQAESAQVASDLATQQASLDRMKSSVGALLGEIKTRVAGNVQLEQQVGAVEEQLQQLQQDIDNARARGTALPVLQQRQQMAELQVRVQDLQASLGLR